MSKGGKKSPKIASGFCAFMTPMFGIDRTFLLGCGASPLLKVEASEETSICNGHEHERGARAIRERHPVALPQQSQACPPSAEGVLKMLSLNTTRSALGRPPRLPGLGATSSFNDVVSQTINSDREHHSGYKPFD
ncbi:hypothetical protein LTS07_004314 [Exophiala sideris]|uniref:Uncharacterized protein n=1 Tax=Exophiala sideris TaxID=1016849 RepID=A0ABR0JEQ7_9EURO|nr:hypothetical protein LTS07_004314 [Exophiala sideris]KAK5062427.1 hypothetical protein LTR69_004786 [Exophiala sideris]KAK5177585.1 hypothetical protein LTR44_009996 [Eurotiomycetes sp. CCFEE 6388]